MIEDSLVSRGATEREEGQNKKRVKSRQEEFGLMIKFVLMLSNRCLLMSI